MGTQFKYDCPYCSTRAAGFRAVFMWRAPFEKIAWSLSICGVCDHGLILQTYDTIAKSHGDLVQTKYPFPDEDRFTIMGQWPAAVLVAPEDVPDNVSKFYLQGLENLKASRWDAAGAMFRKAMDVATKQLDEELRSLTLFKRIDALWQAGRLTNSIRDWSHEIRLDGNDAVHDEEPETPEDASAAQKFTEAFLTYTFTLPAMVEKNRGKRAP